LLQGFGRMSQAHGSFLGSPTCRRTPWSVEREAGIDTQRCPCLPEQIRKRPWSTPSRPKSDAAQIPFGILPVLLLQVRGEGCASISRQQAGSVIWARRVGPFFNIAFFIMVWYTAYCSGSGHLFDPLAFLLLWERVDRVVDWGGRGIVLRTLRSIVSPPRGLWPPTGVVHFPARPIIGRAFFIRLILVQSKPLISSRFCGKVILAGGDWSLASPLALRLTLRPRNKNTLGFSQGYFVFILLYC